MTKSKYKNLVMAILPIIIILVIVITSLNEHSNNVPNELTTNAKSIEYSSGISASEAFSYVEDPKMLDYIWEEYIYYTITTIANAPFNTSQDINRDYAIRYVIYLILHKGDYKDLGNGFAEIDPQLVSSYIKQYLNININDVDPDKDYEFTCFYNSEVQGFNISAMTESHAKYNELNTWAIQLDNIVFNSTENTYTAKFVTFASTKSTRIKKETYCILKKRADGTMYFTSIYNKIPNSDNLIQIEGKYIRLDPKIMGITLDNSNPPLWILGEDNNKVFVHMNNRKQGTEYRDIFLVYDNKFSKPLARLEFEKTIEKFKSVPDGYQIITSDKIIKFNKDLQKLNEYLIPSQVTEFEEDCYGYFDVTEDNRYYVYSSKDKGLVLYDAESKLEKLLAQHRPEVTVNSYIKYTPYIIAPVFVDNDSKVIAEIIGYEGVDGYIIIDMNTNLIKPIDAYDLLPFKFEIPAAYGITTEYANGKDLVKIIINKLDYQKMDITNTGISELDDIQKYPILGMGCSGSVYNENFIVYVSSKYLGTGDEADNIYHIVRINLNTMETKTLLSIKAGQPQLLGVLEDGRVIFSYSFENIIKGICVTETD